MQIIPLVYKKGIFYYISLSQDNLYTDNSRLFNVYSYVYLHNRNVLASLISFDFDKQKS